MWNFTVLGILVIDGGPLKTLTSSEATAVKSQYPIASIQADNMDLYCKLSSIILHIGVWEELLLGREDFLIVE